MNTMVPQAVTRREFMSRMVCTSAIAAPAFLLDRPLPACCEVPASRARSTILLWMGGGPSTIDLWDLKPGTATGGPFRPVSTSGDGQICEHLPMLARQMHHFAVIRSMSTRETDHERGRDCMRAGFVPRPNMGSADSGVVLISEHVGLEPAAIRQRYGDNDFGRGCLRARQLVERHVPLVEVDFGGWDNHRGIFSALQDWRLPVMDRAMSALVEDLEQRGLLQHTLIIWLGEFGRTPRINSDGGRDHWAQAWSVVVGGAGIQGGTVIGQTNENGTRVVSEPYTGLDLFATVCRAQGISPESALNVRGGRVIEAVLA